MPIWYAFNVLKLIWEKHMFPPQQSASKLTKHISQNEIP